MRKEETRRGRRRLTLVTGASGFVGTNLVRRLVERGEALRVLLRESSDTRGIAGLPVERVYGDVRDPRAVREAARGCRRVFHTAALVETGQRARRRLREINVGGTIRVAQACLREGVERLVHTSTVATIGEGSRSRPATEETPARPRRFALPYADTKREAEEKLLDLHRAGLPVVIVNPTYIFGAWDRTPHSGEYIRLAARGLLRVSPRGGINVVDVEDVVAGHLRAMEVGRPGERYILGGENLSYQDLFRALADVVHRRPAVLRLPDAASAFLGGAGDLLRVVVGWDLPVGRVTMQFARMEHYVSSDKAARELGVRFGPARGAFEKAYVWFREHGYIR